MLRVQTTPNTSIPGNSRGLCLKCLRAPLTCYCHRLQPFDPEIRFFILIHGREAQKRIATGRLSHLSLENSELIPGYDYSGNERIQNILEDKTLRPVVLYPGPGSVDISAAPSAWASQFLPPGKKLAVFVIDGTWVTARKTMLRSSNLRPLPRISFVPERPSRFRIRRQPRPGCYSTVEAIHQTIELLGPACGFDTASRKHDGLLRAFDQMVDQQIELTAAARRGAPGRRHRQL